MKVEVDPHKCVGSGLCVLQSPMVFDQGDQGIVRLRRADVPVEAEEQTLDAADTCPSGAIRVDD